MAVGDTLLGKDCPVLVQFFHQEKLYMRVKHRFLIVSFILRSMKEETERIRETNYKNSSNSLISKKEEKT